MKQLTRTARLLSTILSLAVLNSPTVASAADLPAADQVAAPTESGLDKRFFCQDGGALLAKFTEDRGRLVAIVDALDGYGPHVLAVRPYDGPPVRLTWSDGERTLTWSPGVQIMWMASGVHRMCGGGGHHH